VAIGESGELRVGVPPSVMLTGLPEAVRRYRDRYPKVRFTLREMATSGIEQALQAGQIDLGFLRESEPQGLHTRLFLTEPLVAVLPAGHGLAQEKQGLKLRGLRKEPFVFFPRPVGPEFYDALMKDCGNAGFVPNIVQEATQWQTVVSFVEAGIGVSLAPACVEKFGWPGVVFRRLPGVSTRVFAAWRKQGENQAACATVRHFLSLASPKTAEPPFSGSRPALKKNVKLRPARGRASR
jgi:DNA-binding transcriptional LysR family regulator